MKDEKGGPDLDPKPWREDEHTTIIVDPFRIKVNLRAEEMGEEPPESWKEVARQVNRHLMRLAAGSTRLLAEVLEGATRLVRGVSNAPMALVRRVERTHVVADVRESMKQEALTRSTSSEDRLSAQAAAAKIEAILSRYRSEGFVASIQMDASGRPYVVVVKPENKEVAEQIVQEQIFKASFSAEKAIGSGEKV